MLADWSNAAVFWLGQCYNPHAREWADGTEDADSPGGACAHETYNLYFEVMYRNYGGVWCEFYWDGAQRSIRSACGNIHEHYDAAFGVRTHAIFERPICHPEEVAVLFYTVGKDACPRVAAACRAQLWAWKRIRLCAVKQWLRAVRALFRPPALGVSDITDKVCACLAAWHAGLPHKEALPCGARWRGFRELT